MKKLILCLSVICTGLLSSCVDKHELVDEESKPSWLGSSIYEELRNPSGAGLQGTFNYYLRLIDDLGYAETMQRTGSKTIFPANDEAFEKFFASGTWSGVTKYSDLSETQKKLLLYSSMLDNALLVDMLSNASTSSSVYKGRAVKHQSALNAIDTITHYYMPYAETFKNNSNFSRFDAQGGISVVSDATRPMIVHFTRDYMLNNNITTTGTDNDFSLITGGDYSDGDAYIYGNKIICPDVTCQNGYIHQVDAVVTPPGNMAQMLKNMDECKIFSHMLDRFAVPRYNAEVTNNYHDWYREQSLVKDMSGVSNPDSIFEIRYLSGYSQNFKTFNLDANGKTVSSDYLLTFDPGWNAFYRANNTNDGMEPYLNEIAAMFVPNDEAMMNYFVNGEGAPIMDFYKYLPNTKENVIRNVDSIPMGTTAALLSNLMKLSFADNVPSKFSSMIDDAADHMDMQLDYINKKADGNYDIHVANNGVIYVMNKVVGPKKYVAVSAPTLFSSDLNVISWIINNKSVNSDQTSNTYSLDLDFYAYLLAMSANYALFMPNDGAFDKFYVNPATLGHERPECVHFYKTSANPYFGASRWGYDVDNNTVTDSLGVYNLANSDNMTAIKAMLQDIMNYHTVVLGNGELLGSNTYYKTKHGGEIKVEGGSQSNNMVGASVKGGSQIDNGVPAANIAITYNMENGHTYIIDRVIQGPFNSVYKTLQETPAFSSFYELCNGFNDELLAWCGISSQADAETGIRPIDQYKVFYQPGEYDENSTTQHRCLDFNIKMFNSYNYTVYVPNNKAMEEAYENGLPRWEEINKLWEDNAEHGDKAEANAKVSALEKIQKIKEFVYYHFQNSSIYADKTGDSDNYSSFLVDGNNRNLSLYVSVGNNKLTVTDASGLSHTVDANGSCVANKMARDFEFDRNSTSANYMKTSSFAVLHEIDQPLYYNKDRNYAVGSEISSAKPHNYKRN